MSDTSLYIFAAALIVISILYSCVGQAGASGYIAAMAMFGFAPASIKPTALILNVLVSAIVAYRFYRSGHFSWSFSWPFTLASLPPAMLGGYIALRPSIFNLLLGGLLLAGALPLFWRREQEIHLIRRPRLAAALGIGGVVGFLSGLTGIGGGVILTPILIYCRWAEPRPAAATSSVLILTNSIAALAGHLRQSAELPPHLPLFAIAVGLGGAIGSHLGSQRLSDRVIYRGLGLLLLAAATKLLFFSQS